MSWLEERIAPKLPVSWRRDAMVLGWFLVFSVVMIASWSGHLGWPSYRQAPDNIPDGAGQMQYLNNVPGQMASIYLLMALAFALALRRGAIDLSIWMSAGAGGLVAASLIHAGVAFGWAFAAAALAGLALGAFNGLLVGVLRLPSVLVTLASAAGTLLLLRHWFGPAGIEVPSRTFESLTILPYPPLLTGRMLIVAGTFSVVLLGMLAFDGTVRSAGLARRGSLFAVLALSGALCGLAGACWLIDRNQAPLPGGIIGDLRAPAAAVLAGALILSGPGRIPLVGVALPLAMLAATIWRQQAWFVYPLGAAWHMGILIAATLAVQWISRRIFPGHAQERPLPLEG